MREVVIVEAGRSPIGKKKGALSSAHPTEMLAQVMVELLKRAKIAPAAVGQVIGGCINKVGAQAFNVTRTAWLTAGLSPDVACSTVDSQCGSSQFAVNLAANMISSGAEDVVLACGVENMSLLPIGSDAIAGAQAGMGKPITRNIASTSSSPASLKAPSESPPSMGLRAMIPITSASSRSFARRARFPKGDSILSSCRSKFRSSWKAESAAARRVS